jgi:hypothetical protein
MGTEKDSLAIPIQVPIDRDVVSIITGMDRRRASTSPFQIFALPENHQETETQQGKFHSITMFPQQTEELPMANLLQSEADEIELEIVSLFAEIDETDGESLPG